MKTQQHPPEFKPVSITLETQEELDIFVKVIRSVAFHEMLKKQGKVERHELFKAIYNNLEDYTNVTGDMGFL